MESLTFELFYNGERLKMNQFTERYTIKAAAPVEK